MKIAMTLSLPSSLLATAGSTTGWRSSAAGPMQAMPLRFSVSLSSSPLQVVFILCHLPFLLLSFSECDLELTPARKGWLSAILFVGMMIGSRLDQWMFLGEGAKKTLPKAQRTRGLSSSYQSNFFRSYHKFLHKS